MNTDDVLERLIAATFASAGPGPVTVSPQLLADAYSEINRLRGEAARAEAEHRRLRDRADQLDGETRTRFARELDAALALMGTRHALGVGELRRDLDDTRRRFKREEDYRRAVQSLPDKVRHGRALAGGHGNDTRLLNAVVETIAKANRVHARALTAAQQHPERMSA